MIKIIEEKNQEFDQKATHPLQSWAWGEARKKMGIEVFRITDGKNIFQLTIHPLPISNYRLAYLPRSNWPSNEILDFLFTWAKKNNIIFIKIEPNIPMSLRPRLSRGKQSQGDRRVATAPRDDIKLQTSPHPLFPPWTQILNLTRTEDELLKAMHPKTRYNIRLAQKKEIIIKEESNEQGYKIFEKLYFETCKRQKYHGHTPAYHQIIWDTLKNNISHILITYYKDIPLAAYQLFYFNETLYYVYGGTSDQYRNLMPANLLMWETIKLGKKLGAKKFDLWGSLPPNYDPKHSWAGFTKFKQGYGTQFVEMIGSYDLVISPLLYKIYNLIYFVRSLIL